MLLIFLDYVVVQRWMMNLLKIKSTFRIGLLPTLLYNKPN